MCTASSIFCSIWKKNKKILFIYFQRSENWGLSKNLQPVRHSRRNSVDDETENVEGVINIFDTFRIFRGRLTPLC